MGVVALPEADYRALDLPSWSTAKLALLSLAAVRDAMERPIETTDAMRLGTMLHTAILEPAEYPSRYVVPPAVEQQPGWEVEGDRGAYVVPALPGESYRTQAEARAALRPWGWAGCEQTYRTQAEARAALGAALPGEWVTQDLYDDVLARAAAVEAIPADMRQIALHEVGMVGRIEGCECKGRADIVVPDHGRCVIIDVKTAADVAPDAITRRAWQGEWAGQLWTYGELARQAGFGRPHAYCVLVVQAPQVSGSPLGLSRSRQPRRHARLLSLTPAMIDAGQRCARQVWRAMRQALQSGVWPDYVHAELDLPTWARRQAADAEVEDW